MRPCARILVPAVVLLLTLTLPVPRSAGAAILTVTDCGDSGSPGQLRHVIAAASPGDTIAVPACSIMLTLGQGGALVINKTLTLLGAGGGLTAVDGGGVTRVFHIQADTVTISGVTIRNGNAGNAPGGGVLVDAGTLTVTNSIVSGNRARQGGGINNFGTLIVRNSTISGNTSTSSFPGGGIASVSGGDAPLTVINTTISGNTSSGHGGGLELSGSTATLTNVTVANNSASGMGGGIVDDFSPNTVTLQNTIVANNTASSGDNCATISATITSLGHNLDSGTSCGFGAVGDLINTNPMLGPLQLNGGPTPTQALLPGSPAIDAGDNAGCPGTDQRGVPRPLDATSSGFTVCDIGAFEVETLGFIRASLALNTATVHPGTPVQGTVTVSNDGGARPVDVYVALALPAAVGPAVGCPSGDAVAFLTAGGATLTCVSSGVQTFAPLLTNVSLPADLFTPVSAPLFSFVWPAGAPLGPYTVAFVVTPVGAFSDGRVNPTAGIVLAPAGFTATP